MQKVHFRLTSAAQQRCCLIVNKDVFERRTSTGSGFFFSFLDSGFAHFLGQLVSIIGKTLRNTNLGASRCFKMKKTSLPVDVRRSKTPLLKARFRRRSTHVPNLTDELSAAKERRLNQFGTAVLVWCDKSVKFDRVCRPFVELNLGSTHGTSSESDNAPVSLQSRTYSVRFGT